MERLGSIPTVVAVITLAVVLSGASYIFLSALTAEPELKPGIAAAQTPAAAQIPAETTPPRRRGRTPPIRPATRSRSTTAIRGTYRVAA